MGTRFVNPRYPAARSEIASVSVSPSIRTASSAATWNVSMRRVTSPRASRIGLPASMQSARASSSARSRKRRTQCSSAALRACGESSRIGFTAAEAAAIAASMIAGSASATRVTVAPEYLSTTGSSPGPSAGRFARYSG